MSNTNKITIDAVRQALSSPRVSTYENAVTLASTDDPLALDLYAWNSLAAGALLAPLHVCEVVIRNAVSDAITFVYGNNWPWSYGFELSLPAGRLKELKEARDKQGVTTTGKLIPELTFSFWQSMFTSRHDVRIWQPYIDRVLPNLPPSLPPHKKRSLVYQELDAVRALRNRIAHHEPIFLRNLSDDYQKIIEVIGFRCQLTAAWLDQYQTAKEIIAKKP